jgi:hypothetical protein
MKCDPGISLHLSEITKQYLRNSRYLQAPLSLYGYQPVTSLAKQN